MLKNLRKISGSVKLSKTGQKSINGGKIVFICQPHTEGWQCADTPSGNLGICMGGVCYDC